MRFVRSAGIIVAASSLLASSARADFVGLGPALQFAVLSEFGSVQTNYNNGNIIGDVGIGSPRQFTISNASLTGNLRFSGAASTSGFLGGACPNNVSGGGCFTGTVITNDGVVTTALNSVNAYSQLLGGESGAAINITTGGSLTASAGTLDASGNRIFTVGPVNFPNGAFTINGSASDYVVLNINTSANLHGQILLAGGITSDHVIINMVGGNYTLLTGGPTLDVNTNGLATYGIFLDPNGQVSATHTNIQGRLFGGSSNSNMQIVSGLNITAPTTPVSTPEPSTAILFATGLAGLAGVRLRRRRSRSR